MKIVIEALPLVQSQRTGVAQYVYGWCMAMFALAPYDEFVVWAPNQMHDPFPALKNVTFSGYNYPHIPRCILEKLWNFSSIHGIQADADIYHLPFPAIPARCANKGTRLVVTIHDLSYFFYPEVVSDASFLKYLKRAFPLQATQSDTIIADSIATKNDIIEILNVDESKIHVVYLGTDLTAPEEAAWEDFARAEFARLRVPERYILSVGTLEPRKNLRLLLRAAHQLREELRRSQTKICLVGAAGWKNEAMESLIAELQLEEFVVRLGYVERKLLPHLYSRATTFVFPSLYEGFGLPVLEALACGAPSIVSSVSSLPEVAGDAALYIDPHQPEELAAVLRRVLDDGALRESMRVRGFAQAQKFSWEKTARETLAVYRSVAT